MGYLLIQLLSGHEFFHQYLNKMESLTVLPGSLWLRYVAHSLVLEIREIDQDLLVETLLWGGRHLGHGGIFYLDCSESKKALI